jgi:hypothetical protein
MPNAPAYGNGTSVSLSDNLQYISLALLLKWSYFCFATTCFPWSVENVDIGQPNGFNCVTAVGPIVSLSLRQIAAQSGCLLTFYNKTEDSTK